MHDNREGARCEMERIIQAAELDTLRLGSILPVGVVVGIAGCHARQQSFNVLCGHKVSTGEAYDRVPRLMSVFLF